MAVRHGQTNWNAEQRFQGHLDIPLNGVGYRQAETVKSRLAGIRFDAAYSSPLQRALATAEIIAADIPVSVDARLIEIHHGSWQGQTKDDIAAHWPVEWKRWNTEPHRFTPPGGEAADSVRTRVEEFLEVMHGTTILCVSHGVVIQTLLSLLIGGRYTDHSAYEPPNGSIHTLWFRNNNLSEYRTDRIV